MAHNIRLHTSTLVFLLSIIGFSVSGQENSSYITYSQGDFTQAIVESDILIENDPSNISAYAVKAWSYIALRRWNDALQTSLTALEISPNDARIIQVVGESYYELDNFSLALEYFDRYLALEPNGALSNWVFYFLAEIYRDSKQFSKADIAYAAAIQKSPNKVEWVLKRAQLKEQRSQRDQALILYRRALTLDAGNTIAQNALRRLSP